MIAFGNLQIRIIRYRHNRRIEVVANHPITDQGEEAENKSITGRSEQSSGFADAAQVRDHDEDDEEQTEHYPMFVQSCEARSYRCRSDRLDAGGDRYRNRKDVVNEQRGTRN